MNLYPTQRDSLHDKRRLSRATSSPPLESPETTLEDQNHSAKKAKASERCIPIQAHKFMSTFELNRKTDPEEEDGQIGQQNIGPIPAQSAVQQEIYSDDDQSIDNSGTFTRFRYKEDPPNKKCVVRWRNDQASPNGPNSMSVLLKWISEGDNYLRWNSSKYSHTSTKDELAGEIIAKLRENGLVHRTKKHVMTKMSEIESNFFAIIKLLRHGKSVGSVNYISLKKFFAVAPTLANNLLPESERHLVIDPNLSSPPAAPDVQPCVTSTVPTSLATSSTFYAKLNHGQTSPKDTQPDSNSNSSGSISPQHSTLSPSQTVLFKRIEFQRQQLDILSHMNYIDQTMALQQRHKMLELETQHVNKLFDLQKTKSVKMYEANVEFLNRKEKRIQQDNYFYSTLLLKSLIECGISSEYIHQLL